jgi:hypothetical protein
LPSAGEPAARAVDLDRQIQLVKNSRARLAQIAADLAETEDTVAGIHDRLADSDPQHAGQYRQAADNARMAARRAREIQRLTAG